MREAIRRWWPYILGGFLGSALLDALREGGQLAWLLVAVLAALLALQVWIRTRTPPAK